MAREIKHLKHTLGGRIERVHAIQHHTAEAGGVLWCYVCDVEWQTVPPQTASMVDVWPAHISAPLGGDAADEAWVEFKALHGELEKYLAANGRWDADVGWVPHKRSGSVLVNEVEEVVDGSN